MAQLDEFTRANARGKARKAKTPIAQAARFDARQSKVVVTLSSGVDIAFPPASAQGLEKATAADLKIIEISPRA